MSRGFQRLAAGALFSTLVVGLFAGPFVVCLPAVAQDGAFGSFPDVPLDHWAFLTVELLVRKYKVMAGFPDGSFKGDAPVSRYELAAALTKVVDRMSLLAASGAPVSPADLVAAKEISTGLALPEITARVDKLEAALKEIAAKPPRAVAITGGASTAFIDNTQDNLPAYLKAGFGVDFKTTVLDGIEIIGSMGGDIPAATSGNKPATAGSDKPPESKWNFQQAHMTSHPMGGSLRTGLFRPADFFGSGSSLKGHWGGLVGNGFIGPDRNTVRWGDKAVAIAATGQLGGLIATAAVTPVVVVAGLDYKLNDFLRFKVSGDTDQPEWGNLLNSNRASAHNFYAVADVGTGGLGFSLQGGLAKDLIQASGQVLWAPLWDVQLGLGAVYRTSDKGVTEVTPGVSLYIPSFAIYAPAVTLAVKEPQVIATSHGTPGPGSLLGEQAGVSTYFEWKLEDYGYPNFKFEYNIQQPVLLYSVYDATVALEIGRGF
jgi:hypothetical protein